MRGIYTVTAKLSAIASAQTLLYLTAPAGKIVELQGLVVTNESNSTSYQMQVALTDIGGFPATPTATAKIPKPKEPGDQAAGSAVFVNVTANEPNYAAAARMQRGVPSVIGLTWEPLERDRYEYVAPGQSIGVRLVTTPGAATDFDVEITFREIG
jgi:hypothetical protein